VIKKIKPWLVWGALLGALCAALSGCHTIAGIGEDTQAAGQAIRNAASK